MDRRLFLVDFENVNRLAFTGVSALTEWDEVIVLYTQACVKAPKALEDFYLKTKATLTMMYAENGHKNALDFQLSALLGRLSTEEKFSTKYYIIAKDKGYDCLSIFLTRFGIDVMRRESIYAAITGMDDPIATAEVETEEEMEEQPGEEEAVSAERIPEEEVELETLDKKAKGNTKDSKGKKKDKKKKKEGKEKEDKEGKENKKGKESNAEKEDAVEEEKDPEKEKAEKKKKKGKKETTVFLVELPSPWTQEAEILPVVPVEIKSAPVKEEAPQEEPKAEIVEYSIDNLPPELALVVQAIRERFSGPYLSYQDLAIEAYLHARARAEGGRNLMELAHRYISRNLRIPAKVKKVYTLLKPFLK